MHKCLLWGGFAGGNVGDELTLAIALQDMELLYPQQVAILSHSVEYTQWLFPNYHVIRYKKIPLDRKQKPWFEKITQNDIIADFFEPRIIASWVKKHLQTMPDWVKCLKNAEMLYLVGGGYLTDLFDIKSFLLPVTIANEFGVKILTAPLGIGPFRKKRNLELFKKTFTRVPILVRDSDSLDICTKIGLNATLIKDDGFRLRELSEFRANYKIQNFEVGNNLKIGICAYNQHGSASNVRSYTDWWVRFLRQFAALGLQDRIEGFCFHNSLSTDFNFLVNIFKYAGFNVKLFHPPPLNFYNAIDNLSRYSYVIATRFHAVVCANALDIPATALYSGDYYKAKMISTVETTKGISPVCIDDKNPEIIANQIADSLRSSQTSK